MTAFYHISIRKANKTETSIVNNALRDCLLEIIKLSKVALFIVITYVQLTTQFYNIYPAVITNG